MAGEAASQSLQTYKGNCHCGAFRYSVTLPTIEAVVACNCSICSKKGYLWAFPASDQFVVEKGAGSLQSYEFGNKTMAHKFCPTCGTPLMGQRHTGRSSIGINVRAIQDLDLESLNIQPYDGTALQPAYQPPMVPEPSKVDASKQVYQGSCHCGKVTFNLQSEPLSDLEVTDCNCSICSRNAYLWLYPPIETVEVHGDENLRYHSRYHKSDQEKNLGHAFCSICGVFVLNTWGENDAVAPIQPINVRAINRLDFGSLKMKKFDGKGEIGEPYVLDAE